MVPALVGLAAGWRCSRPSSGDACDRAEPTNVSGQNVAAQGFIRPHAFHPFTRPSACAPVFLCSFAPGALTYLGTLPESLETVVEPHALQFLLSARAYSHSL